MMRNQMKTPPHKLWVYTVHCNTALSRHKNTNIQQCNIEFSVNYYIIIISSLKVSTAKEVSLLRLPCQVLAKRVSRHPMDIYFKKQENSLNLL